MRFGRFWFKGQGERTMIIKCLVENTSISQEYKSKHGLSIYIETTKHKILFDLGPNGLFLENAKKLGIDITDIDTVVISHGHADHGKGLKAFMDNNHTAKIYLTKTAFDKHYVKVCGIPFSVGLDESLKDSNQIVLTDEICKIDDELTLFSGVKNRKLFSTANKKLLAKYDNKLMEDLFEHEHYLIVREHEHDILFTGCSHNGIVNILEKYNETYADKKLECVIGGFHLFNPTSKKYESDELITSIAGELCVQNCKFYTCHCTGTKAYQIMKKEMNDKLGYLASGMVVEL